MICDGKKPGPKKKGHQTRVRYTRNYRALSAGTHGEPDVVEMIRAEEEKVVWSWKEQIHRAAQDPAVRAEIYELCRRTLIKYAKKGLT